MSRRGTTHLALPLEDSLFISLQKAADSLGLEAEQLLKPHGLTGTQYNVLRILRGAEPDGLPCRAIGEFLLSMTCNSAAGPPSPIANTRTSACASGAA